MRRSKFYPPLIPIVVVT